MSIEVMPQYDLKLRLQWITYFSAGPYVDQAPPAEVLSDETADTIHAALRRLRFTDIAGQPPESAHCAAVEIMVKRELIEFHFTVDPGNRSLAPVRLRWDGLKTIEHLDRWYEKLQPGPTGAESIEKFWSDVQFAGQLLHALIGMGNNKQTKRLAECLHLVRSIENIHFRFSLPAGLFPGVPFDLVFDSDKNLFLRETAPVARRIFINDAAFLRKPGTTVRRTVLTGRVLFIRSDAHGSLQVPGRTFNKEQSFEVKRLQYLDDEYQGLVNAREKAGLSRPEFLDLHGHASPQEALLTRLEAGPWDIVHFAGHSVRDDSGEVLLLLPGAEEAWIDSLRIASFEMSAAKGRVGLVLLSSCQSRSSDTVFRLAQTGVPAAIGFRWDVDDNEAGLFMTRLHTHLASGESLGRAYHSAVRWLRTARDGSLTFASPVLVIQEDDWATGAAATAA
jgi:CHAT domain